MSPRVAAVAECWHRFRHGWLTATTVKKTRVLVWASTHCVDIGAQSRVNGGEALWSLPPLLAIIDDVVPAMSICVSSVWWFLLLRCFVVVAGFLSFASCSALWGWAVTSRAQQTRVSMLSTDVFCVLRDFSEGLHNHDPDCTKRLIGQHSAAVNLLNICLLQASDST